MTQSSMAISSDGVSWYLLNVSPDVRQQVLDCPELAPPESASRGSGIAGCVLTDAELDHTVGLLLLRERSNFSVLSTGLVHQWLNEKFPIEPVLNAFGGHPWSEFVFGEEVNLCSGSGEASALWVEAFDLDSHPPLYVGAGSDVAAGSVVGLKIRDANTGSTMVFAPGVESINDALRESVKGVDALFFDGTCWSNDEMIALGFSDRSALDMGHMPVSGDEGSLGWLESLPIANKVFFHMNNTNPMLNRTGTEYRMVVNAGLRIAADGDRFEF